MFKYDINLRDNGIAKPDTVMLPLRYESLGQGTIGFANTENVIP